jgi:excisionase family DNA binding protein
MKTSDLSIKELAAYIGVSTDTIRRAVRKGEIPSTRVGTALRFDLRKVQLQMELNAAVRLRRGSASAPGGTAGRAQADQPPSGNTGALPTGIVTGGLSIL